MCAGLPLKMADSPILANMLPAGWLVQSRLLSYRCRQRNSTAACQPSLESDWSFIIIYRAAVDRRNFRSERTIHCLRHGPSHRSCPLCQRGILLGSQQEIYVAPAREHGVLGDLT